MSQTSSQRQYERITEGEMDAGMRKMARDNDVTIHKHSPSWTGEYLYDAYVREFRGGDLISRTYSSIRATNSTVGIIGGTEADLPEIAGELTGESDAGAGDSEARDAGEDSIRVVLGFVPEESTRFHPVALPETEYTKRIPTWLSNLKPKVKAMVEAARKGKFKLCPDCGSIQELRETNGVMYHGCIDYPECNHTEALPENPGCPDCGSAMVTRAKEGTEFWGCLGFPDCEASLPTEDNPECPDCGSAMIEREIGQTTFWGCLGFPDCRGTRVADDPECQCGAPMIRRNGKYGEFFSCLTCDETADVEAE